MPQLVGNIRALELGKVGDVFKAFLFQTLLSEKCSSILFYSAAVIRFRKKGTKAVTGAVPFQKVQFCQFYVLICTF